MLKVSRKKLVFTMVGMAAALPLTAGIASATPDLAPVVNTTCSYDQVIGAMNAERPDLAQQFNAQPVGQAMLRNFLGLCCVAMNGAPHAPLIDAGARPASRSADKIER